MEVGRGIEEDIWKAERSFHDRTSPDNTRPGQENASGSRYIRLCNGGSIVDKI